MARRTAKAAAKADKRGTAPIVPGSVTRGVLSAKSWYDDQHRLLWAGVAGAVALIGGAFALNGWLDRRAQSESDALRVAVATASAPIIPAETELPEDEAPEESYPSLQARAAKAKERFEQALKKDLPDEAVSWARLGEATALAALAKPTEAYSRYEAVAKDTALPAFVRWRALEGAGYALEAQNNFAEAAKRYEQVAKLPGGTFKFPGDYHHARMLVALNERQKAAELLQASIKAERARPAGEGTRFPELVSDAETLLTELSVQLNAPNLRPDAPAREARPSAPGQGGQITPEMIEELRRQIADGNAQPGAPGATPAQPTQPASPVQAPKGGTP